MISIKAAAIAATIGVALTGFVTVPAHAEPVSNSLAIVGSDTLEDVVNGIVNGAANVRFVTGGTTLGSFDATGSPTIITKPNGVRFGRPNGSGDGVKALSYSISGQPFTATAQVGATSAPASAVITNNVDIARSSSLGTANSSGALLYVPFGRDGIAYAYGAATGSQVQASGIGSLTVAQLTSLYTCGGTPAAGSQTLNGTAVQVYIPQSGSGTRKDFLSKLGLYDSTSKIESSVLGAAITSGCVKVGQEHDASTLALNEIMPMSTSRWIAMSNGFSFSKRSAVATLAGVADTAGTPVAAVDGTEGALTPNAAYYAGTTWGRDTYVVVQYTRVDITNGAYDANLAAAVDNTNPKSLTYNGASASPTTSLALKKKFGFLAPSSAATPTRVNVTS